MADTLNDQAEISAYEAPRILATFEAAEILAEAETSSVVIIVS